jgi:hypothetical protein
MRVYYSAMDAQSIGTDSAQARIQDQVATTMLSKGLKGEQEEAAELLKSLGPASPLPEGSGSRIDLLA